jgi:hypothetical protein
MSIATGFIFLQSVVPLVYRKSIPFTQELCALPYLFFAFRRNKVIYTDLMLHFLGGAFGVPEFPLCIYCWLTCRTHFVFHAHSYPTDCHDIFSWGGMFKVIE